MEKTGSVTRKLAKVRTFRDDAEHARSGGRAPHDEPAPGASDPLPNVSMPAKDTSYKESAFSKETIFKAAPKPVTPPAAVPATDEKPAPLKPTPPIVEPAVPTYKVATPKPASAPNQIDVKVPKETLGSIVSAGEQVSVMDADDYVGEGTIVTDKKLEHFNLFTSMWIAVRNWFVEEKAAIEEKAEKKRQAIPTVRSIDERREIVEKASKQSALAPKDDYRKLAKKLPPVAKDKKSPDKAALTITKRSEVKAPGWNHFTGQPAEPAEVPKAEETTAEPAAPKIPSVIPPLPPKPAEPPSPQKEEPATIPAPVPETPAPSPKPAPVKVVGRSGGWSVKVLAYTATALVGVAAVASGVGLTWWLFSGSNEGPPILVDEDQSEVSTLVRYDELILLALPNTDDELWQGVLGADLRPGTNLVVIVPVGPGGEAALPEDVIALMGIEVPGSFARNVSGINFGSYRSEPFIIMRVIAFDTAFGGILSAEDTLKDDLALFKDTSVSSATSSPTSQFVDDIVQNHDVRVLKVSNGDERFIYGFVNRNTILIAKDRDTFSTVADAMK